MTSREQLKVRAVRAEQGQGTAIFAFFLFGAEYPSGEGRTRFS